MLHLCVKSVWAQILVYIIVLLSSLDIQSLTAPYGLDSAKADSSDSNSCIEQNAPEIDLPALEASCPGSHSALGSSHITQ